jgi:hypothetical protein
MTVRGPALEGTRSTVKSAARKAKTAAQDKKMSFAAFRNAIIE